MKPLVSIVIPAYNAEKLISFTLESAIAQTWPRKEIIVVNDGSTDATAEVARRYGCRGVTVVSTENQGVSAAKNRGLQVSQGDYIQILDADDILAPDKIERQVAALREGDSKRILLSSAWAHFFFRTRRARFAPTELWQDLSPVEWLLRKMGHGLHMQPGTWLTSRELIEAAGLFDQRLHYDDDGEYFCRVLLASEGTRFVREGVTFYRISGSSSVSYVGNSTRKRDALLLSMKLHIQYLRSLEESERVRRACLNYLQKYYIHFYPERPDIVGELDALAAELKGQLDRPRLRWKYAWMKPIFGWKTAKSAQRALPQFRGSCIRCWDKAMYQLEARRARARPVQ